MQRLLTIILLLATLLPATQATAQTPLAEADAKALLTGAAEYCNQDWTTVRLSGKLRSSILPVTPTVKIYMQRDRAIVVTLHVFLLGEVGRAEIRDGQVTAVNKMKRVYFTADLSTLLPTMPMSVGDLQCLLLGYPFLLGKGLMLPGDAQDLYVYQSGEDLMMVLPKTQPTDFDAKYGFEFYPDGSLALMMASAASSELQVAYDYSDNESYDMQVLLTHHSKQVDATLSLDAPAWGAAMPEPYVPSAKEKQVTPSQFFKSF